MNETPAKARDYSETLFLPKTDFPMRAGLPQKEPEILARWRSLDLYGRLRAAGKGRPRFILHDGPPYANGNIHIGHALNKILKDVVTKSQQMLGFDSNYVPGWDCHGLPIEWKIEEENYRAKGKPKPDFSDPAALVEFRQECRAFAEHWIDVQREEFERLGVVGDWAHPYTTMDFFAEAQIARELMKFAANGTLYRGSKPVMWSVVEKTALAEAEVEYEDYTSDTVWVKFPIAASRRQDRRTENRAGRLRLDRYLDHDALDASRATARSAIRRKSSMAFTKSSMRRQTIGRSAATNLSWPTNWRSMYSGRRVSPRSRGCRSISPDDLAIMSVRASAQRIRRAATSFKCRSLPAITSPTTPAPASCTPRPATAARTSTSGPRMRANWRRAASTRRFPTPSTPTAASPSRRRALPASASSPTKARRATPTKR